ncbi:MAG: glycosyltransferase, partial [Candidatus Paceibacterota bacterium]
FAARILRIPVVIHEADTVPSRVNLWAAKFARIIAISHPQAASYFPKDKVIITGNPIRKEILYPIKEGARDFLKLEPEIPVIFVIGGSQGAMKINDVIVDALPELVKDYQIIHQTGRELINDVSARANFVLENSLHKDRYKIYDFLNPTAMRMVGGVADLAVSRSGSGIFEIANWKIPAIVIPIPETISRDQRQNALAYAESGAAEIIEESNFTSTILLSEIRRILKDPATKKIMSESADRFATKSRTAAVDIASRLIEICLEHENS